MLKPGHRRTIAPEGLALKQKLANQRQYVIAELVKTEIEYIRDLKMTYDIFNLQNPSMLECVGIDVAIVFGNILEVMHLAEALLNSILPAMKGKEENLQTIIRCFMLNKDKLQTVYGEYCGNYEEALNLLIEYKENKAIMETFQTGIEILRQYGIVSFDISAILIKPVQRILKYPLILQELGKNTEDIHPDKSGIELAWKTMTEVAAYINEYKRRKNLVLKYLDTDDTLVAKMSALSTHSIRRKSPINTKVKDVQYNEKEKDEEMLMSKYPKCDLFFVREKVVASSPLHLEATRGTLVAVIKRRDPAGDVTRWFVDKGSDKGFIQSHSLRPIPCKELLEEKYPKGSCCVVKEDIVSSCVLDLDATKGTVVAVIKRQDPAGDATRWFVDDGATKGFIQSNLLEPLPDEKIVLEKYPRSNLFVVSKKIDSTSSPYLGATRGSVVAVIRRQDPTGDATSWLVDNGSVKGLIPSSALKPIAQSRLLSFDSPDKQNDSSKLGENLLVGNEEGEDNQTVVDQWDRSQNTDNKFYSIKYNFDERMPETLTVRKGQVVILIKPHDDDGNSEWWFVQDRTGRMGYVPNNYLAPWQAAATSRNA